MPGSSDGPWARILASRRCSRRHSGPDSWGDRSRAGARLRRAGTTQSTATPSSHGSVNAYLTRVAPVSDLLLSARSGGRAMMRSGLPWSPSVIKPHDSVERDKRANVTLRVFPYDRG
jgi:hypothetical protein